MSRIVAWAPCLEKAMSSIVDERGFNQGFKLTASQQVRLRRRADAIAAEMDLPVDPVARARIRILELGCGTGELAWELVKITGAGVTGVDLSPKFIEQASALHSHPHLDFRIVDLTQSSPASAEEKFHYIVGNGILHHLYYRLDSLLPALAHWTTPGGRLIFWEPNLFNPYVFLIFKIPFLRRLARLEPDEMAFSPRFIRDRLNAAGFTKIKAVTRDFLLPNTPRDLVSIVVRVGDWFEKAPIIRAWAQSVFIVATVPS